MKITEYVKCDQHRTFLYEGLDSHAINEAREWERILRPIVEAQLTPDQINTLFQQAQQVATAGGANRTGIGKGVDAAKAAGEAFEKVKAAMQNSGPIQGFEAQYDQLAAKLKEKTGGDQGVMQYIQKYRDFATKHPVAQKVIYAAAIAALGALAVGGSIAAVSGGPIVLGLFKMTDRLLQGDKLTSAAWQGVKVAGGAAAAVGVGKAVRGALGLGTPTGAGNVRMGATSSTADLGDQPTARTSKLVNRPDDFSNGKGTAGIIQGRTFQGGGFGDDPAPTTRGLTTDPKQFGGVRTRGGFYSDEEPTAPKAAAKAPAAAPTIKNPQFDPMGNYTGVDAEVPAAPQAAPKASSLGGSKIVNRPGDFSDQPQAAPAAEPELKGKALADKRAADMAKAAAAGADGGDVTKGFSNDVDKAIADKNSRYSVFKKPTGQVSGTGVAKGPTADTMADNNLASIKNNRDVMNDFAKKMGLTGDNHKASFSGGVPTVIDGKPVPDNLYTSDQRANIKAAKQMAAQMQGDYKDVMAHQAKIKADMDAQMQAVQQAQQQAGVRRGVTSNPADFESVYEARLREELSISRKLPKSQITEMFRQVDEGVWDAVKKGASAAAGAVASGAKAVAGSRIGQAVGATAKDAAGAVAQKVGTVATNMTTKVTSDKLMQAWKTAGSPTDSAQVYYLMKNQGLDDATLASIFKAAKVRIPVKGAKPPASTPPAAGGTPPQAPAAGGKQLSQTPGAIKKRAARAAAKAPPAPAAPAPAASKGFNVNLRQTPAQKNAMALTKAARGLAEEGENDTPLDKAAINKIFMSIAQAGAGGSSPQQQAPAAGNTAPQQGGGAQAAPDDEQQPAQGNRAPAQARSAPAQQGGKAPAAPAGGGSAPANGGGYTGPDVPLNKAAINKILMAVAQAGA